MVEQNRLITVTGGKLTTFRVMAAQAVDRAWEIIKGEAPQPTPTAQTTIARPEPPDLGALPEAAADRLSRRYGPDAEAIARLAAGPFLAAFLDEKRGLLAAEVLYAVEQEMGLTLEDVMVRRLGLTYHTTDAGREALFAVADRMAGRLGWTSKEKNAQIERDQALLDRETRFKQSGRQG
jgi:glycerol-3-phosphate dehydrogenase